MKNYTITVNGNVYQVTVEEGAQGAAMPAPAAAPAPRAMAPAAAAPAPAPAPAAAPAAGAQGGVDVTASVPGKIISVEVKVGDTVKAGDTVIILEAMKMEIPDGTIASINVGAGTAVESGDVLATMN